MWWVVRHPATKQTRWAIYLFFCSDRTALHLACLGSGVWRGHTLNKLQTDSSVNASPIVLSLYTIPVGRCVLCAHYLSRDAAKRGDSLSQRAAVGKEMKVRCFFGCHVERGQPAHTEGEEKKKTGSQSFHASGRCSDLLSHVCSGAICAESHPTCQYRICKAAIIFPVCRVLLTTENQSSHAYFSRQQVSWLLRLLLLSCSWWAITSNWPRS